MSDLDTTGVSDTFWEYRAAERSTESPPCAGQSCHCDGLGPTGGSWVGEGGTGKCGAFRVWRRWDELAAVLAWRWADRLSRSPKESVCVSRENARSERVS